MDLRNHNRVWLCSCTGLIHYDILMCFVLVISYFMINYKDIDELNWINNHTIMCSRVHCVHIWYFSILYTLNINTIRIVFEFFKNHCSRRGCDSALASRLPHQYLENLLSSIANTNHIFTQNIFSLQRTRILLAIIKRTVLSRAFALRRWSQGRRWTSRTFTASVDIYTVLRQVWSLILSHSWQRYLRCLGDGPERSIASLRGLKRAPERGKYWPGENTGVNALQKSKKKEVTPYLFYIRRLKEYRSSQNVRMVHCRRHGPIRVK